LIARLALVSLLLLAGPAHALDEVEAPEQPACLTRCLEMGKTGDLRPSMSAIDCTLELCQSMGRTQYEENQFDEAIASLDQVKGLAGTSASYNLDRGLVLYAVGRFDEALGSFDTVLASFPQSVRAAAQRAHTLMRLERLPEARAQFQSILEFDGADAEVKRLRTRSYVIGNLGVLRLEEGDVFGGKKQLEESLENDGRNKLAHTYLRRVVPELEGRTFGPEGVIPLQVVWEELEFRRANSAVKKLGELLRKWPDFKLGYVIAADAQRRYGNIPACEATLRAAQTRFPDDTDIRAQRIRCSLLRKGVHSTAALPDVEELEALAKKNPNDPFVKEMLELIYE
jgi:tetratricopeptide (TPR) repeat protein